MSLSPAWLVAAFQRRASSRPGVVGPGGRPSSARRRGQSVVEFGLVVMLFVLLISGMFDFGVLLNARLSISSMSRVIARAAAENALDPELIALANQQEHIIGVTTDTFDGYVGIPPPRKYAIVITRTYYHGSAEIPQGTQKPGDTVKVKVQANGMEVVNPMVRPIFGCTDGTLKHCFVPISADTTMMVEFTGIATTPTPGP